MLIKLFEVEEQIPVGMFKDFQSTVSVYLSINFLGMNNGTLKF